VHVIVVGCGRVGSELAGILEKSANTVTIIDKKPDAFRRLPTGFGGQLIEGFGFDRDTLIAAGAEHAGALAAVTSGDNSNIMAARVAREVFSIKHVVARIYDPRRAAIYERLGIPTVATVAWTTDQIMRRLVPDEHEPAWVDPSGRVCLIERPLPTAWAGHKLAGLQEPGKYMIVAVDRTGRSRVYDPSLVGQEGDTLRFIVDLDAFDALKYRMAESPESTGGH
jgi:trk system potassium uptake protein TrkA